MSTYTDKQLQILTIVGRCSAAVSCVSSMYIIGSVSFSQYYRSRIYHRLMLGFSIALWVTSINYLWGPAAVPKGTPGVYGANGTTTTCSIQGFITQLFSLTALFYYTAIAFYSFFAIRNKFNVTKLRKLEPWLHCSTMIFPVASSIYLLSVEALNFTGGNSCWIEGVPPGCGSQNEDGIPCTRGPQNIGLVLWICGALPTLLSLLIPTAIMIALYLYVSIKQNRQRQQQQQQQSTSNQSLRLGYSARTVATQAGLYLLAIYWSNIFLYIEYVLSRVFGIQNFVSELLSNVQLRLLGFYTLLAYLKLRHSPPATIHENDDSIRNSERCNTTSKKAIQETMESAETAVDNNIHNANDNTLHNRRRKSRSSKEFTFSIFDGERPSGQWAEFIYSGDEDDDEEEQNENERWADIQSHI